MKQSKLVDKPVKEECKTCYNWDLFNGVCISPSGECDYTPINDKWYKVLMDIKTDPDILEKHGLGLWRWKTLREIRYISWC